MRPLALALLLAVAGCEMFTEDSRLCVNEPLLTGFAISWSPPLQPISRGDDVEFTATAERVVGVGVTVQLPTGSFDGCYADSTGAGGFSCTLTIASDDPAGTWSVDAVLLDDTGLGQFCEGTPVTKQALRAAGYPTTFEVIE